MRRIFLPFLLLHSLVIEYSNIEIGKFYSQENVSDIIKRLFSTNLFTDINVKVINNTLIINVIETPIVSRINIKVNKLLESEQIFFNRPLIVSEDIKHSQKESRFFALGHTDEKRKLFIVFTVRNKLIRVISARDMSRKEKKVFKIHEEKDT